MFDKRAMQQPRMCGAQVAVAPATLHVNMVCCGELDACNELQLLQIQTFHAAISQKIC
jgi:hypothetical protein